MNNELNDNQFLSLFGMEEEQQKAVLYNTYLDYYQDEPVSDLFLLEELSLVVKKGYIALHLTDKSLTIAYQDEPIILYSRSSKLLRARRRKDWEVKSINNQTFFYHQIRKQKLLSL
jgi:hypothetical protein